jgi:hypothetical protein
MKDDESSTSTVEVCPGEVPLPVLACYPLHYCNYSYFRLNSKERRGSESSENDHLFIFIIKNICRKGLGDLNPLILRRRWPEFWL